VKETRHVDTESGEVTEGSVRPFADVLRDLGKGQVADEAAVLLTDLVHAVTAYGKKGTFRLDVTVEPFKGGTSQLMVSARATSHPPAGAPVAAVFFTDDRGNLLRNDPRMEPMFDLREVARPDAELRNAE
jgi:hypothetical protein